MKLQECKARYFVSVPKDYVKLLGWKKGDTIIAIPEEKGLLLKKLEK